MAALAVGREGLEAALFFFTAAQATGRTTEPLIGFLVGIAVAITLAYLVYRGAVRLDLGRFFSVTGILLIFVVAGILAYGVHDLQEAAILPGLNVLASDVSAAVPPDSWYGVLLKGIVTSPRAPRGSRPPSGPPTWSSSSHCSWAPTRKSPATTTTGPAAPVTTAAS